MRPPGTARALWAVLAALALAAGPLGREAPAGQVLDQGLTLEFHDPEGDSPSDRPLELGDMLIADLTIDPAFHDFTILCASEHGNTPLSPQEWAGYYGLEAVINAGMYLKDGLTSTGLLRTPGHVNNPRLNGRFGAFFVFNPLEPGMKTVDILERARQEVPPLLDKYGSVAQNYRLVSSRGENLWPRTGDVFTIACVALDSQGLIHFIHCGRPMSVHDFNEKLLKLPMGVVTAMYVEGGPQAALYVNTPALSGGWGGSLASAFFSAGPSHFWPVPNVIGVRKKGTARR